jgi:hypothetical protein
MSARTLGALALLAAGAGGGCGPAAAREPAATDRVAIVRAALTTLFLEREHAGQLVLWRGPRRDAPTLGMLPGATRAGDSLALLAPDAAALALPVPVRLVGLAEVEAHFAAHPDAWEAWFARFPGSAGIVEVTRPRAARASADTAWLVVARACGEHCRMAWRVTVARDAAGAWRTTAVRALALPRS